MRNIHQSLLEILDSETVSASAAVRIAASLSPLPSGSVRPSLPLATVRPLHTGQLGKLINFCRENRLPLRVRGGNTGWFNAPLPESAILLDMTGLNRILELDVPGRVLVAQAGCNCDSLRKKLAAHNLFLPWLYPSGLATAGAVLAANAWGPESPKYGAASMHALALKVWDGTGVERLCHTQNCRAPHLDASLPLGNLFCGSRCRLGLIAEVELSLLPMPQACARVIASFSSAENLAEAINSILLGGLEPASMLVFNQAALKLLNFGDASCWLLAMDFYENRHAIIENVRQAEGHILENKGAVHKDWAIDARNWLEILPVLLNGQSRPWKSGTVGSPAARLASLLEGIEELAKKHDVESAVFGPVLSGRARALVYGGTKAGQSSFLRELFILDLVLNSQLESDEKFPESRMEWLKARKEGHGMDDDLKKLFDPDGIFPAFDETLE